MVCYLYTLSVYCYYLSYAGIHRKWMNSYFIDCCYCYYYYYYDLAPPIQCIDDDQKIKNKLRTFFFFPL